MDIGITSASLLVLPVHDVSRDVPELAVGALGGRM
jgi:hypothetical protein